MLILLYFVIAATRPLSQLPARSDQKAIKSWRLSGLWVRTTAAEVGNHSFTNALTHELAIASKVLPFTISELHARVVSKLKCYAPELLKLAYRPFLDAIRRAPALFGDRQAPISPITNREEGSNSGALMPMLSCSTF